MRWVLGRVNPVQFLTLNGAVLQTIFLVDLDKRTGDL